MNMKTVIFAGIMNALIFAMLGLGINYISERNARKPVVITTGAIIGFLVGSGFQIVLECKDERENNNV